MKKILIIMILLSSFNGMFSQVLEPVSWKFSYEEKGQGMFEMVLTATIDKGWHLYALDIEEGGPIPTSVTIEEAVGCQSDGKAFAVTEPEVKFDQTFGMKIGMFSLKAELRQKVKVENYPATVKGYVTFMSCDDTQCLPPRDVEFEVKIARQAK